MARRCRIPQGLFTEAMNAYLSGDTSVGKSMLRDLINAAVGFEGLAEDVKKPSKSLHRMLAEKGNPSTENFFGIVRALAEANEGQTRNYGEVVHADPQHTANLQQRSGRSSSSARPARQGRRLMFLYGPG